MKIDQTYINIMDTITSGYFVGVSIIMLPVYIILTLWFQCRKKGNKEVVNNVSPDYFYRQISKLQTQMGVIKATTDGLALVVYQLSSELKTKNEVDSEIYEQHEQQTEKLREEISNLQEKLEKFGEITLKKLDLDLNPDYNADFLPDEDDSSS